MHVGDVRVDLRRRYIAVAEQRLHGTRVSAVLQQMSRETVTQRVWRNVFDPRLFSVTLDHGPCELSRERPPTMQKNIWATTAFRNLLSPPILLQPVNQHSCRAARAVLYCLCRDTRRAPQADRRRRASTRTISETRSPVAYIISSTARSRMPSSVAMSGAASKRLISSSVRNFGR